MFLLPKLNDLTLRWSNQYKLIHICVSLSYTTAILSISNEPFCSKEHYRDFSCAIVMPLSTESGKTVSSIRSVSFHLLTDLDIERLRQSKKSRPLCGRSRIQHGCFGITIAKVVFRVSLSNCEEDRGRSPLIKRKTLGEVLLEGDQLRLITIKGPKESARKIAAIAFSAGITEVCLQQVCELRDGQPDEIKVSVKIATSTPTAKAFVDEL